MTVSSSPAATQEQHMGGRRKKEARKRNPPFHTPPKVCRTVRTQIMSTSLLSYLVDHRRQHRAVIATEGWREERVPQPPFEHRTRREKPSPHGTSPAAAAPFFLSCLSSSLPLFFLFFFLFSLSFLVFRGGGRGRFLRSPRGS